MGKAWKNQQYWNWMAYVLYLHLIVSIFSQKRECACTTELKNYASRSLVAGRATHFGHVLRGCWIKRCPGPPGWGLGVGLTSWHHKTPTVGRPWPKNRLKCHRRRRRKRKWMMMMMMMRRRRRRRRGVG